MSQPQLSLGQSGQVLANPNLALVFWGQFWANHPDFVQTGTTFFMEFLRGQNVDRLGQYGVNIGQICSVNTITQPWIGGIDIANSLGMA
ncbi:MAG: hypothetical protein WCC84_03590, partial [Candidatus Cybelea sp.]